MVIRLNFFRPAQHIKKGCDTIYILIQYLNPSLMAQVFCEYG